MYYCAGERDSFIRWWLKPPRLLSIIFNLRSSLQNTCCCSNYLQYFVSVLRICVLTDDWLTRWHSLTHWLTRWLTHILSGGSYVCCKPRTNTLHHYCHLYFLYGYYFVILTLLCCALNWSFCLIFKILITLRNGRFSILLYVFMSAYSYVGHLHIDWREYMIKLTREWVGSRD